MGKRSAFHHGIPTSGAASQVEPLEESQITAAIHDSFGYLAHGYKVERDPESEYDHGWTWEPDFAEIELTESPIKTFRQMRFADEWFRRNARWWRDADAAVHVRSGSANTGPPKNLKS